jgi:hypothetical protein
VSNGKKGMDMCNHYETEPLADWEREPLLKPLPINERVKRWDVYDIADELADVPGMLTQAIDDPRYIPEIQQKVYELEQRLWAAAERGGVVGPARLIEDDSLSSGYRADYPKYESIEPAVRMPKAWP